MLSHVQHVFMYILHVLRDSADAMKAWRLAAWGKGCQVAMCCCPGGFCGLLGDPFLFLCLTLLIVLLIFSFFFVVLNFYLIWMIVEVQQLDAI